MRKSNKRFLSVLLAAALVAGIAPVSVKDEPAQAAAVVLAEEAASGSAASGPATSEEPVATPEPTTNPVKSKMKLSVKSVNMMAGKSFKLSVSKITKYNGEFPKVTFTAANNKIAKITSATVAANGKSASANVKLLKKGSTVIRVNVNGTILKCKVKAVAAFSKADFGGYRPENFITYFSKKKKDKNWDFGFDGEWGQPDKYGVTYRGLRIGMKLSDVKTMYGDVSLNTCDKKTDPFLYDYQFNKKGKLKVSQYANFSLKEDGIRYNLRIYFTPKNKVFGFIMLGGDDFKKISKATLNRNKTKSMRLI